MIRAGESHSECYLVSTKPIFLPSMSLLFGGSAALGRPLQTWVWFKPNSRAAAVGPEAA
jgi:hypothetical protein